MTLDDLILDSNAGTLAEAAEILGCNVADLGEALPDATAAQRAALEYLAGLTGADTVSAIELLDLADATRQRGRSAGHIGAARLAYWYGVVSTCPIERGELAGGLALPALGAPPAASRARLNMQIRALSRALWGAVMIRRADLAVMTDRRYTLGDLRPVFAEVLECGADDLRLARRARQLAAALAAWRASKGSDHRCAALHAQVSQW